MIAYSCVVDASIKLYHEACVWIRCLRTLCGIPPDRIFVHVVAGVPAEVVDELARFGCAMVEVEPFHLDHRPSNKLQQLVPTRYDAAQWVVLLDVDVELLAPYDAAVLADETVSGVPVFGPNPPLPVWRAMLEARGADLPADGDIPTVTVATGWRPDSPQTYRNNLNGGLYAMPLAVLRRIGPAWRSIAHDLLQHREKLQGADPAYTDQISFALAMHGHGLLANILDIGNNCPPIRLSHGPVTGIHAMRKLDHTLYSPDGTHIRAVPNPNEDRLLALDEIIREVNGLAVAAPYHFYRAAMLHALRGDAAAASLAADRARATGQLTPDHLRRLAAAAAGASASAG